MIWQSNVSNYLPTYGYNFGKLDVVRFSNPHDRYMKIKKVKESCAISANVNGNNLSLKSVSNTTGINLTIPLANKIETTYSRDPFSDRLLQIVGMVYPTHQSRRSGGYQSYMVSLGFDDYELAYVSIQEMACETPNCDEGLSTGVRGGFSYLCSDRDDLFKP